MADIQRRDRKAYGEIQKFFRDQLERTGDLGVKMRGEWEGCRRAHVYGDRYRIIWRELPETEDYAGGPDDKIIPVQVLRAGPKTLPSGETIYQQPNPAAEQD
jgi:hypothetical protein